MPNYELEMAESVIAGRELKILELEAEITRLTAIEVAARDYLSTNSTKGYGSLVDALAADKPIEDDK